MQYKILSDKIFKPVSEVIALVMVVGSQLGMGKFVQHEIFPNEKLLQIL